MHFSKATVLAVLGFGAGTLANIYPDEDPCNPYSALPGEYREEFNTRIWLDSQRCGCVIVGPQPSETRQEYDKRNDIDNFRCAPVQPFVPLVWAPPPPLIELGPIIVEWRGSGPYWRDGPIGWDNVAWRNGLGRGFPRDFRRPDYFRGGRQEAHREPPRGVQPYRGGARGPEPHREPARVEPHREPARVEPHREPARVEPHREPARVEPHREPARVEPHREPARVEPHRGGRPRKF